MARLRRPTDPEANDGGERSGDNKGHRRALTETVDSVVQHRPSGVCCCGGSWQVSKRPYYRHQVFELPVTPAEVTEHQLFGARCHRCGRTQRARLPDTVPAHQMGPRLLSWISLYAGRYHLSLRQIQALLHEQFGLQFSVGTLSQAQGYVSPMLTRLHQRLKQSLRSASRLHIDETPHQRAGESRWLWLGASEQAVCIQIHPSRARRAAQVLVGQDPAGVVISDGLAVYHWLAESRHQLCWAHVLRQVRAIAERPGWTGQIGAHLYRQALMVFQTRHRYEQHRLDETRYHRRMQR